MIIKPLINYVCMNLFIYLWAKMTELWPAKSDIHKAIRAIRPKVLHQPQDPPSWTCWIEIYLNCKKKLAYVPLIYPRKNLLNHTFLPSTSGGHHSGRNCITSWPLTPILYRQLQIITTTAASPLTYISRRPSRMIGWRRWNFVINIVVCCRL